MYFRKNPFGGEYTVFAGLEECIRLIANFHFKEEDISFMRSVMPTCEVWHTRQLAVSKLSNFFVFLEVLLNSHILMCIVFKISEYC